MTLAEVGRQIESNNRIERMRAREKAAYDYILADAIGRSVARVYSSTARYPEISKLYPSLFDDEEMRKQKEELKLKQSVLRFKQFAAAHNNKHKKEVASGE